MENQNKKLIRDAYKQRKVIGGIYSIKNTKNNRILLMPSTDLNGTKNRFEFAQMTGSCVNFQLQEDWNKFGKEYFIFEIVEELEKGELQTTKEFQDDLSTLKDMCKERFPDANFY